MTEELRRIEAILRGHPKAAQHLNTLAQSMPEDNFLAQFKTAQYTVIDYVHKTLGGDAEEFFRQYSAGKVTPASLIMHAGRMRLGISPEKSAPYPVYR